MVFLVETPTALGRSENANYHYFSYNPLNGKTNYGKLGQAERKRGESHAQHGQPMIRFLHVKELNEEATGPFPGGATEQ
jgi:hypothetical protein